MHHLVAQLAQRYGKIDTSEGLVFLGQILSGEHPYGHVSVKAPSYYFETHPLTGEQSIFTELIGETRTAAQIGPFIKRFTRELTEAWQQNRSADPQRKLGLTLYFCNAIGEDQHMVFAEYRIDQLATLVGGGADYSEEGGTGAIVLASIFILFSSILGLPLHVLQLDHAHYTQVQETIQQEVKLQQKAVYNLEP